MRFRKLVGSTTFLSALLFAATLFLVRTPTLLAKLAPWLSTFLPMLGVFLVFMAWRFHRGRVVFAALTLGLAYAILAATLDGQFPPAQKKLLFYSLSLVVSFNFSLLALMQDRGVFGKWGFSLASGLGVQAVALTIALHRFPESLAAMIHFPVFTAVARILPWISVAAPGAESTPQIVVAALVSTACVLAVALAGWRTLVEAGLCWAMLASTLGLFQFEFNAELQTYFAFSGIVLFFSVLEFSYSLAYRDELTGLPARRALQEAFKDLGGRYTIAMVDVDHFKSFNDQHGHDVGDQVLKLVASRLAKVGGGGHAFRYGGEEFSIVFNGREIKEVLPHLEDLREEIAMSRFVLRNPARPKEKPQTQPDTTKRSAKESSARSLGVTVSIGVAMSNFRTDEPEAVLKIADQALYQAKDAGRNRVVAKKHTAKRRKKPRPSDFL